LIFNWVSSFQLVLQVIYLVFLFVCSYKLICQAISEFTLK
jgi:hypothetical protein